MSQYINRTIEKQVEKMKESFPVILLSGARNSGKSTLVEYIKHCNIEEIEYVTFDNMSQRLEARENPEKFIKEHKTPLIIDEFQFVPEIIPYIKYKVDQAKRDQFFGDRKQVETMYYLVGSQEYQTIKNLSESLTGRIGYLDLYPLSTREIEAKKEDYFIPNIDLLKEKETTEGVTKSNIFKRIIKGSYPIAYNSSKSELEKFYSSYIRTYIERDIRNIINIKNETKFLKFISAVAMRTGKEYNASDIGKEVGINNKTADEWLTVLKNTYLVYLLQPYANNVYGRAIKRPKIYFMDTGLACFLTGYFDAKTLEKSTYSDAIFETYIISEIVKSYANNSRDPRLRLFYYRDNNHKEIDLIVVDQDKVYPVEIKKDTMEIKENDIKNLYIKDSYGRTSPNGIIICTIQQIYQIDERNYLVPIEYV